MEAGITDSARSAMVRAAVARVGRDELKAALDLTADPRFQAPKAVANAAQRPAQAPRPGRRGHQAPVPGRPALCGRRHGRRLSGPDHRGARRPLGRSDQGAVARRARPGPGSFADTTIAVMLATRGRRRHARLRSLLRDRVRRPAFRAHRGVRGRPGRRRTPGRRATARPAVSPEQREARRQKKQRDAEERRKKMEAARKAGEQVRRERKKERTTPVRRAASRRHGLAGHQRRGAPRQPAGHADPAPGGGVRPARPTGRRRRLRLGAVRPGGSRPVRARGQVPPLRRGGRIAEPPAGPTRATRRAGARAATGSRCRSGTGGGPGSTARPGSTPRPSGSLASAEQRPVGRLASGGLERPLVRLVGAALAGRGIPPVVHSNMQPSTLDACVARASKR